MQNPPLKPSSQSSPIFLPISEQAIAQIQTDTLCLEGEFHVNHNLQQEVRATLSTRFLALTELGWFDAPYHYCTALDFELKFEQILQGDSLEGRVIGFRLHRGDSRPVELTFAHEPPTEMWVKWMARLLNQLGFHRLFKPVKKLGKGGFAVVYEVERLTDHRHFAVKAFSKQTTILAEDRSRRLALINQIGIMRTLDSQHCIKLEAVFQSENSLYVVLQLLSAGHLHARINHRQGRFTQSEVRQLMVGLARGLADLHSHGIMHRDIKPQNIMLREEDALHPVIADFGLAAFVEKDDYLFYRCGTPGYVAPEINALKKGQKASPLCDIFSAGAIFHVLLVRRALFEGRRAEQVYENNVQLRFDLNSKIYDGVDPTAMDLLRKMLKVDPRERISADEMLQHPFLSGWAMQQEKQVVPPTTLAISNTCRAQ